jgi:phosphatidylglycerophosphatase B
MRFLGVLFVVLATLALINEFVTKPLIAAHRPFVLKLDEAGLLSADELYALTGKPDRTDFLRKILDENPDHPLVRFLDPHIKEHWALHTGFSFPSGHSQNAFLFAVILGFLIQHLVPSGRRFVWIPFLWASGICLSRVALGVHSPLDITVGALTGGILGSLILMSGLLNKILPTKTLED